jgi:hypothetical protein
MNELGFVLMWCGWKRKKMMCGDLSFRRGDVSLRSSDTIKQNKHGRCLENFIIHHTVSCWVYISFTIDTK